MKMKSAARIVKQKRLRSIKRRAKRKKIRSQRKNLMMKAMKSEPNSRKRRRIRKIRRKRNVQTLTIAMRIRRRKRKRIKRARRTRRIRKKRKSLIKRKWVKLGCRLTMKTWSKLPRKLSSLVSKSQQGRLKTILNRNCRLSAPGNKRRTKRVRRRKRVVH